MTRTITLVGLASLAVACGSSAVAPSPMTSLVGLTVSQPAVTLGRFATTQVAVVARYSDNSTRDVTAEAVWGSANTDVVTAAAGRLTAVGIGTTRVGVSFQGRTGHIDVTARRNTALRGELWIADAEGKSTLGSLRVFVNGVQAGDLGSSDHGGFRRRLVSIASSATANVDPGTQPFAAEVTVFCALNPSFHYTGHYEIEPGQSLQIIDRDTSEVLERVPLSHQRVSVSGVGCASNTMTWPIDVPAFTNATLQ